MSILIGVSVVIITKLNNMYQGKVLFDYSQEIVGKFTAYLISVYLMLFFLMIGVFLKLKLVTLLTSNFLPKTPPYAMLLLGISLFGYVAYKGITNVARAFEIIGVLFLIITVGICMVMLAEGMNYNILPFFNPSDTKNFMEAMRGLIIPFSGAEILFIIPFTKQNKKAAKVAFFTLLFIGLFYVLIVEGAISILGINNAITLNDAFVEAIKVVEIPVIERTDIFYLTFGLTSLFAGMIIIFTAVAEFACRLFSKVKRLIIVMVISVIYFILCLFGLNIKNFNDVFESFAIYLVLISGIFMPTLLFIVAKIRKRAYGRKKAIEK